MTGQLARPYKSYPITGHSSIPPPWVGDCRRDTFAAGAAPPSLSALKGALVNRPP